MQIRVFPEFNCNREPSVRSFSDATYRRVLKAKFRDRTNAMAKNRETIFFLGSGAGHKLFRVPNNFKLGQLPHPQPSFFGVVD